MSKVSREFHCAITAGTRPYSLMAADNVSNWKPNTKQSKLATRTAVDCWILNFTGYFCGEIRRDENNEEVHPKPHQHLLISGDQPKTFQECIPVYF
jgi:hypothetical protein